MKLPKLFDDTNFYKNLFTLAIPIMLQGLINAMVNMVDTIMIGRLGTEELAAVGLGNQIFFLYNITLFGIASGGAVFTAQFWGKGDIDGIRKTTGLSLTIALMLALIFTLAGSLFPEQILSIYSKDSAVIYHGAIYLRTLAPCFIPFSISFIFTLMMRSTEKVRLPMISTLISLTLNVILNYLLIYGFGPIPAFGVKGAALATVCSRLVELVILLSVSYAKSYAMAGRIKEFLSFDAAFVKNYLIIALPVIINEIIWATGVTVQNIILARTHTNAIAAFNITSTVSNLAWVYFIGIGSAASVLIGKKIGEGSENLARSYASRIVRFAPLSAAIIALGLIPLSWTLPYFFKVNAEVLAITAQMFIILVVSYPFRAFNMAMVIGVCRSGGDTLFSIVYDTVFMWLVTLPMAAAASFLLGAPIWLVYLCLCLEDPFKMTLGLGRLRSGKWLRNVVQS